MKKALIAATAILCLGTATGQNTFPSTGKVGIGTTTPAHRLTVMGESYIDSNLYLNRKLYVTGKASLGSTLDVLGVTNLKDNLNVDGAAYFNTHIIFTDLRQAVDPFNDSTASLLFLRGDGEVEKKLTFDVLASIYKPSCKTDGHGDVPAPIWSNGENKIYTACGPVKVGIGTDDPTHRLHVSGSGLFNGNLQVDQLMGIGTEPSSFCQLKIQNSSRGAAIQIDQNGNAEEYAKLLYMEYTEPTTEIIKAHNTDEDYDVFLVQADGRMVINNGDGKIFQINPDGLAQAREVLVDLEEWPDYVFENDYQLMPLSEVESYIAKEGHLPNVPSARTVEAEGIKLGEMNKLLMEKIEELTLHLIEQDKKISELQKQVSSKH